MQAGHRLLIKESMRQDHPGGGPNFGVRDNLYKPTKVQNENIEIAVHQENNFEKSLHMIVTATFAQPYWRARIYNKWNPNFFFVN